MSKNHAHKRKLLSILLIFNLSFGSIPFVHSASYVYGDMDGNSQVDSTDYALLKRYLIRSIPNFSYENAMVNADLNGDSSIDSTDYALLKRYLIKLITKFPVEAQIPSPTLAPTPTPTQKPTPTPTQTSPIHETGNVTYTLVKASNPTSEQIEVYKKIEAAMDVAISYYNKYTTITKKIQVYYEPSVSTADANINGVIRFGSNKTYMNHITAMHEIAHTAGVGTSGKWRTLISGNVYTGVNATNALKQLTGDNDAILKGDNTHFWPYGLNYTSEVKSENDLIIHCKIVDAMKKDGI